MEGADLIHLTGVTLAYNWRTLAYITYTSLDNLLSLVTQSFLACDDDFFSSLLSELAWIWFLRRQLRRVCPHLPKFALWDNRPWTPAYTRQLANRFSQPNTLSLESNAGANYHITLIP